MKIGHCKRALIIVRANALPTVYVRAECRNRSELSAEGLLRESGDSLEERMSTKNVDHSEVVSFNSQSLFLLVITHKKNVNVQ